MYLIIDLNNKINNLKMCLLFNPYKTKKIFIQEIPIIKYLSVLYLKVQ